MAVQISLLIFGGIVAVPGLVLFVECMAALFARKSSANSEGAELALPARIGVLISAHNEELLIEATVRSIVRQLRAGKDELLVVADNCTDKTAALARTAGSTVIERHDLSQRGKGYGLAFGVEHLRKNPPDVVILFDADIVVETGVIARLALEAAKHGRPIQALYLQKAPKDARPRDTISALAFLVKNAVRPAGLDRLGVACALTGSGMAFQWGLIEKAPLASGHLVEDMELGLNFLRAGKGPKFCPAAMILGELPSDSRAAYIQRTRWEHGHLGIIRAHVAPLLISGVMRLRYQWIATALDLAVPPLALLAGAWFVGAAAALSAGLFLKIWAPAMVFGGSGLLIGAAILSAWRQHARQLPLRALLAIPLYVIWKVPLYFRFLFKRQTTWVRTARTSADADGASTI